MSSHVPAMCVCECAHARARVPRAAPTRNGRVVGQPPTHTRSAARQQRKGHSTGRTQAQRPGKGPQRIFRRATAGSADTCRDVGGEGGAAGSEGVARPKGAYRLCSALCKIRAASRAACCRRGPRTERVRRCPPQRTCLSDACGEQHVVAKAGRKRHRSGRQCGASPWQPTFPLAAAAECAEQALRCAYLVLSINWSTRTMCPLSICEHEAAGGEAKGRKGAGGRRQREREREREKREREKRERESAHARRKTQRMERKRGARWGKRAKQTNPVSGGGVCDCSRPAPKGFRRAEKNKQEKAAGPIHGAQGCRGWPTSSRSDPTALTAMIHSTPSTFMPKMFAR